MAEASVSESAMTCKAATESVVVGGGGKDPWSHPVRRPAFLELLPSDVENRMLPSSMVSSQFAVSGDENAMPRMALTASQLPRPSPLWPLASINASWMAMPRPELSPYDAVSRLVPSPNSSRPTSPQRRGGCFQTVSGRAAADVREMYRSIIGGHQIQCSTPILPSSTLRQQLQQQQQLMATSSLDCATTPSRRILSSSAGATTRRLWSPYSDDLDEVTSNSEFSELLIFNDFCVWMFCQ